MAQLRQDYTQFQAVDAEVMVIGPENADAFAAYWQDHDLPFIGLPDPNHSVIKLYGQELKLYKFGRMPAMAIVDKKGVVRFVHYGHAMTDIPENADVLETLREL